MVPLADVEALKAAPIPFTVEPALPGGIDWLGTRTLAFVPAGRCAGGGGLVGSRTD